MRVIDQNDGHKPLHSGSVDHVLVPAQFRQPPTVWIATVAEFRSCRDHRLTGGSGVNTEEC